MDIGYYPSKIAVYLFGFILTQNIHPQECLAAPVAPRTCLELMHTLPKAVYQFYGICIISICNDACVASLLDQLYSIVVSSLNYQPTLNAFHVPAVADVIGCDLSAIISIGWCKSYDLCVVSP